MGHFSCETKWTGGQGFEAQTRGHRFVMDTKKESGGNDQGPTPKEVLLASICACSGIDVVSILQKMRIDLQACDITSETETTSGYPAIFKEVLLKFRVKSSDAKEAQVMKAVTLSMTKYCGVSAMVVSTSPIKYQVFLNEQLIGEGRADFSEALAEAKI